MTTSRTGRMLVTGAAGKVGQAFLARVLRDPAFDRLVFRALTHRRPLAAHDRLDCVQGSIQNRADVERAMSGVTHVLHLATSKETPDEVMDVAVKGMFWILEACRSSPGFEQLLLVGGDAGMGHFFYPHPVPVVETQPHSAYPGCYALSKVLEEVMLHSTWLDNTKARFLLGWRPKVDMAGLVEAAWSYRRSPEDPRHVWYPG